MWVDGAVHPAAGPHLSVADRGFQLGDGIFETLRAKGGHASELPEHLARLRRSATGLAIELPADVEVRLTAGIAELLAAEGLDGAAADASVRITVSRGAWASRGLLPPAGEVIVPTLVIQVWPVAPVPAGHLEHGLAVVACSIRRDPANPIVSLKTTSRADYVYARIEARRAGAEDALFLTTSGYLSEATTANIFLVRDAPDGVIELATPSLDCAILPGTTRTWLLRWASSVGPSSRGGLADAGRAGRGARGVHVLVRGGDPSRDPVQRARHRGRSARPLDPPGTRRPGGVLRRGVTGVPRHDAAGPAGPSAGRGVPRHDAAGSPAGATGGLPGRGVPRHDPAGPCRHRRAWRPAPRCRRPHVAILARARPGARVRGAGRHIVAAVRGFVACDATLRPVRERDAGVRGGWRHASHLRRPRRHRAELAARIRPASVGATPRTGSDRAGTIRVSRDDPGPGPAPSR